MDIMVAQLKLTNICNSLRKYNTLLYSDKNFHTFYYNLVAEQLDIDEPFEEHDDIYYEPLELFVALKHMYNYLIDRKPQPTLTIDITKKLLYDVAYMITNTYKDNDVII